MIVVDSSAMVEALVGADTDADLLDALQGDICAPHLLDIEVLSALRGLTLGGQISPLTADRARAHHFAFTILRYEFQPLADRVWQLHTNFTVYDACYLALAEATNAPLYTCDRKLLGTAHHAQVRLVPRTR